MSEEIEDKKAIWKSKTLIGIMMVWVGFKLRKYNINIPEEMLKSITDFMIEGGTILAGLGRIVASQKLR